ncbi:MAG TPA: MFS transporter [Dehalococcoidia bacterium]|nr:MFS transporter [Dehalococcoidia bacterium]
MPVEALTVSATSRSPIRSLRHRDYTLMWLGLLFGSALVPMQFVTQILFLSEHAAEGSRLVLAGLLGASRGAAMLLFSLFGGAFADRFDRRRLLIGSQFAGLLTGAAIAVVMIVTPGGTAMTLSLFLVLVFLAAGLGAIDAPTRVSMVPELVGREDLPNAIALDAVAFQIAFPLGLPLTGVLIDAIGFGWTYVVTLGAYASLILTVALMKYRPVRAAGATRQSVVSDIRAGFSYARARPSVLWIIALSFAVNGLGFPVVANLGPVWTSRVLGLSPTGVGLLAMTWGVGSMVASLAMTNVGHFSAKGYLLLAAAAGFALCVVLFGYSRSVPLSAVINVGLGGLLSVSGVAAASLVQRMVHNDVQGRVMSLFMMSQGVSQLLTLPIGLFAQWATLQLTLPLMGWICLAAVMTIALSRPAVRRAGHEAAVDGP